MGRFREAHIGTVDAAAIPGQRQIRLSSTTGPPTLENPVEQKLKLTRLQLEHERDGKPIDRPATETERARHLPSPVAPETCCR